MNLELLVSLKEEIKQFIQSGGDIYDARRRLPYYEKLRYVKSLIEKDLNKKISIEDVYAILDIKFNRQKHYEEYEYNRFCNFCKRLIEYADEDGFVDIIRTKEVREKDNIYEILKNYADKYDCSPFDFLFIMTGYKFRKAYIELDYISYLQQELKKAYPNGDIKGIKYQRPDLYEAIRHLRRYLPEQLSMQEVAEFLGITNERFGDKRLDCKIDRKKLIEDILKVCPDRNVTKLQVIDSELYKQAVRLSVFEDKTPAQWFKENRFVYDHEINAPRLSKKEIDTQKRVELLLEIKQKILSTYNLDNVSDIEFFKIQIDVMKQILQIVKNENEKQYGHEITEDKDIEIINMN